MKAIDWLKDIALYMKMSAPRTHSKGQDTAVSPRQVVAGVIVVMQGWGTCHVLGQEELVGESETGVECMDHGYFLKGMMEVVEEDTDCSEQPECRVESGG